jgi:hypothetical protein
MYAMSNACRADLGFLEAGSRATVEISGYANVRLIEPEAMVSGSGPGRRRECARRAQRVKEHRCAASTPALTGCP